MAYPITRPITRKIEGIYIPGMSGIHTVVIEISRGSLKVKLDRQRWTSGYEVPWGSVYLKGAELKAHAVSQATPSKRRYLAKRGKC
jgi:hypothetical protein